MMMISTALEPEKPTVIEYTLAKLRTNETMDHGSTELATGEGIVQNVHHGSAELQYRQGIISKRSCRYIYFDTGNDYQDDARNIWNCRDMPDGFVH